MHSHKEGYILVGFPCVRELKIHHWRGLEPLRIFPVRAGIENAMKQSSWVSALVSRVHGN